MFITEKEFHCDGKGWGGVLGEKTIIIEKYIGLYDNSLNYVDIPKQPLKPCKNADIWPHCPFPHITLLSWKASGPA